MAERRSDSGLLETPHQDWGLVVGVGIVALGVLVAVVNLSVEGPRIPIGGPRADVALPTSWVQVGRWAGLAISLVGGGCLLWRFLRRRASERDTLQVSFRQAVDYIQRIGDLLRSGSDDRQQQLLAQIHAWQRTIEAMVEALAGLGRGDGVIQRDLDELPGTIAVLERQLATEIEPSLRADLEQMLRQRQDQRQALEQLQTARRRAEIQVERTTAVLGTIYSHLLACRSVSHAVDYQRLADEAAAEVQHLQSHLEALQGAEVGRS